MVLICAVLVALKSDCDHCDDTSLWYLAAHEHAVKNNLVLFYHKDRCGTKYNCICAHGLCSSYKYVGFDTKSRTEYNTRP